MFRCKGLLGVAMRGWDASWLRVRKSRDFWERRAEERVRGAGEELQRRVRVGRGGLEGTRGELGIDGLGLLVGVARTVT